MTSYYEDSRGILYNGDCLEVMRTLPSGSVDAVLADPPYSSGGLFRSDRLLSPADKYATQASYEIFSGDNRDARSWSFWSTLWITQAFRILKEGGYFFMFTDWRQLPTASDAIQAGGIIWRGIIVWDKTNSSRAPHKGYFRHQCEYILWGSKGKIRIPEAGENNGPFSGCYTFRVHPSEKQHMTAKPVELMKNLLAPIPEGSVILDPFAGSGTSLIAARDKGHKYIGIELSEYYCGIAGKRLNDAENLSAEA